MSLILFVFLLLLRYKHHFEFIYDYHAVNLLWFSRIPSLRRKRMAIMAKNIEMYVIAEFDVFIIA